jgi:phosphoserine phosphatase RsbU/P
VSAASGSWNDNFGTLDYSARLAIVAVGAAFGWFSARLQMIWSEAAAQQAAVNEERAAIGEVLQRGLMPERIPDTPGWSVGTLFRPGGAHNEVGGDFYDVFPFGAGWMAVIGDITGHGPAAASVTAQARHSLRNSGAFTNNPQEVLSTLNDSLLHRDESDLCSLLAFFFGEGGSVTLALAGHPPPLLVSSDDVHEVGTPGPLLGAFADSTWSFETIEISLGRHLVGYTDGVTELVGKGERFDVERLCEAVAPTGGPAGAIHAIERALEDFGGEERFEDDVTLLAIGRAPQLLEATGDVQGQG